VIETNLTGMFLVTRAALLLMRTGGTIINNLSVAARLFFPAWRPTPRPSTEPWASLTRSGGAGDPRQIRVIALLAGATDTAIWEQFWPDAPRQKMMSSERLRKRGVGSASAGERHRVAVGDHSTGGAL